ncbi:phospholipid/cholesterol/gamma-HCH transport system substrate-binding protein [Catalinimonas alkaloidigena]|uniref:Phospholipid/cholesterol/gamma-HCH transport system substrate-binding protein n=1 Tax=Catalinimonas alkaloidigena TaxID=1075417 RepID=A0A1G9AHS4_9BACT|nr:MlaD family protein [Catalinimonas alkaloidigena]SDK26783.1 phospholipid/cholesterol/gamma-HCH transport system substrate-binding protein [Catalinimonas alkaloidigena]
MKVSKEFKVGLLTLVSGTILYLGFNFLKGADLFSSSRTYYTFYENVDGLTVSNAVMLNGLAVGRVEEIKRLPERNNMLQVAIDIDDDIVLGRESRAVLTDGDLLGGKMIRLELGDVKVALNAEDTLTGTVDESIVDLLQEKTLPVMDNLNQMSNTLNGIISGFSGTADSVNMMLREARLSTNQLRLTLSENRENILGITRDLSQFTGSLTEYDAQIGPMLTKLNAVADTLQQMELAAAVQNVNQSVANLNATLAKVNKGEGTLGKLANDAAMYNNLNASLSSLDELLVDLREHPKRYVHFSIFGRKDKSDKDDDQEEETTPESEVTTYEGTLP